MQNGAERILYIYDTVELDWFPIGCLTSNSFSEGTEMLNATMRSDPDGWMQAIPGNQSYSLSFAGILTLDDRGGTIFNYEAIQALKRARTKIQWRVTSDAGEAETGYGYIISLSNAASLDEFVTFDGEITGVGEPTTTAWVAPTYPDIEDMIPPYEAAQA
jgi:hypothetical protein